MSYRKKESSSVGVNTEPLVMGLAKEKARSAVKTPTGAKEREIKHLRVSNSLDLKNSYSFGAQIGKGGFGTVISVVDRANERNWAMKIISKEAVGTRLKTIEREIQILKMVEHPHIIYLHRVYESVRKIYLILERCFGTLLQVFDESKPFCEENAKKVVEELLSAVSYLHKNDIVHRDLKMENILIAKNPNNVDDKLYIKLTDFGLSIVKKGCTFEDMLHDCCGTLLYMAPEVITKHSYSELCDVWAIGVITYTLLSGRHPFRSSDEDELAEHVINDDPDYSDFQCSTQALHLISKMLVKNPALRITAGEALAHSWILGELSVQCSDNVLDMMRMWRSEMMLPVGEECDWVSSAKEVGSLPGLLSTEAQLAGEAPRAIDKDKPIYADSKTPPTLHQREMLHLPVADIRFNQQPAVDFDKLCAPVDKEKRAPGGGAAGGSKSGGVKENVTTAATSSKRREKTTTRNLHASAASNKNKRQSPL